MITCLTFALATGAEVTVTPEEYSGAIRNPMKGFRGNVGQEFTTLSKTYIRWNEIEARESDGIDKIRDYCDNRWSNFAQNNVKAIPRVYLDWDGDSGNEYWPSDMTTGDYTSAQFQQRLERLVSRLGQVWDEDPRVAYVEMGIIGYWGEHHSPSPTPEMQQVLGDAFTAAFKNKLVMVRHPWMEFTDYPFGGYWDSWAHINQMDTHGAGIASIVPRWKVAPMGGECAYNWGDWSVQPGDNPTHTLSEPEHRDYLLNSIRLLHGNHLGWVSGYDEGNSAAAAGARIVQRAFGHRFIITEARYPDRIDRGQQFKVSFAVINTGSSPFYYNWPVELSLLDASTRQPVFRRIFGNADVTQWMPGDNWDESSGEYLEMAVEYQVSGDFLFPDSAQATDGVYILALAMLDPAGLRPSNRFAIRNYFTGGHHPMGYIGVGQDVTGGIAIDPGDFDDMDDGSLDYASEYSSRHTLTINAQNGTTYPDAGEHDYYPGSSVTVTATPQAGYQFTGWTGDVEGDATGPSVTVTMDRPRSITAAFEPGAATECFQAYTGFSIYLNGSRLIYQSSERFYKFRIFDASGKMIISSAVDGPRAWWDGRNQQGAKVPAGIYLLFLQNRHSIQTVKFIFN
jgi:uncharacterized repeat protein (TIGR02543 family)